MSIIAYCCASRPVQDSDVLGGDIDATMRVAFTELSANSDIEVVSSSALDTQSCVIAGRTSATGPIVSTQIALNGTTPVAVGITFERILSVQLGGIAQGTVTVRKIGAGATIGTIPVNEKGFSALFINSGFNRDNQVVYDKFFWLNSTGKTITIAQVDMITDAIGRMSIAVSATLNDTQSVATRLTAPTVSGQGFVGLNVLLDVPDMTDTSKIGVWMKQTIPGGSVAELSTFTSRFGGISS